MIQTNTLVKSQKITSFKRSLAVVIGINEYHNKIPKLQTARRDAEVLAQILAEEHQYDEVILITDETECKPTLKNLLTLLEERLPKEIQPTKDDRLLFYFAGHGIARDSDKGPAGCLVPQDADLEKNENLLPMQKLHDCLSALSCRHLLVILDCCFAGTIRWSTARLATVIPTVIRKEHYDRFIKSPAWQAITSAAHNQEASDTIYLRDNRGGVNHSPFAEALFKALRGEGDVIPAAKNGKSAGDGVISATELYLYLRDNVETASNESQTPGIWTLSKHDRGEYIFLVPGADPKLKPAPKLTEKNNPYRGLQSFEEEHSQLFFGRKELVEELYKKVSHASSSLTVVLGVSGSGKSSLVKAGLIPYLRQHNFREWYILKPMRPSESPFTALARTLMLITNNNEIVVSKQLDDLHFIDEILQQKITDLNQKIDDGDINSEEDEIIRLEEKVKKYERFVDIWKRGTKETKQRLIVDYFDEFNNLCHDKNKQKLLQEAVLNCLNPLSLRLHDPNEFIKIVKIWSEQRPGIRLLLVIDQFEELITLSSQSKEDKQNKQPNLTESQQFLKLLEATLAANLPQLSIVVTLRSDFEPRFLNSEALKSYWTHARFPVRAMRSDELRQAIERPAAEMALYFEQLPGQRNPVDKLVEEVGQMPGALPLLSFTLSELYIKLTKKWEAGESSDRALILDAEFDKEGGVAGSLTQRANKEYDELPDDAHRDTMRRVMLRMVTIEGGELARRRVSLSELVYADKHDPSKPDDEENQRVDLVLERLNEARLVVSGQETGEPYVEPAHDFLVRSWDKLQKWQQQEQENLALQRRLTPNALEWKNKEDSASVLGKAEPVLSWFDKKIDSAEDWFNKTKKNAQERQREKKGQFLWNGNPYLDVLRNKLKSVDYWFNQVETEFVQRSIWQRRRNTNLRWGIMIVIMAGLAGFSYVQWRQNQEAQSINLAASSKTRFASDQQLDALVELIKSGKTLRRVIGPDAKATYKVVAALLQTEYNIKERNRLQRLQNQVSEFSSQNQVSEFSFSRDSSTLISKSVDGAIQYLSLEGNEISAPNDIDSLTLQPCQSHGGGSSNSPDGKIQARWNYNGFITLSYLDNQGIWQEKWKVQADRGGPNGPIFCVYFSPKGNMFASVSNETIKLWSVESNLIKRFPAHNSNVESVRFSPDGKSLASAGHEKIIKIWNLEGKELKSFPEDSEQFFSISFSPDGKVLASVNDVDRTITLWSLEGNKHKTLDGENGANDISFSPDGKMLASASNDGNIKFWRLDGNLARPPIPAAKNRVISVSFSPDGKKLVSFDRNGSIKLWNLNKSGNEPEKEINGYRGSVSYQRAIFSPDGKKLAVYNTGEEGKIRLLSIKDTKRKESISFEGNTVSFEGNTLSFSPDGKMFASGTKKGDIKLLTIDGEELATLKGHSYAVSSLSFSPDGKTLASASEDGTIVLWNLDLDQLLAQACDWARGYLENNPNVNKSDRHLCDDVPKIVAKAIP
ncbi:nSTAND1 domain-containing NTPase [Nostoc sp.]|uniref:nSTAND1 domain-containing NTPase n=1 Tax=Nostoc sp. TaxID=1180 RepID=UPI002FFAEF91